MRTPVTVVVIAKIRIYRDGLADLLGAQAGIEVQGVGADAASALEQARDLRPDILLLDVGLAGSMGAAREIHRSAPGTRVVALAMPEYEREVIACAEAGMSGYVTPEASIADVVQVVRSVVRGELPCSPAIAASLASRVALLAARLGQPLDVRLTAREREIAGLLGQGLSNKQIASRLSITISTVKNHVHSILEKLGASRRSEVPTQLDARLVVT